jgi:ABC-type lipoprotein release transport system permease subunit
VETVIRSFLFGVRLNGIVTIFAATLAFAICAALASYIPARRAAAVDPMYALREQ